MSLHRMCWISGVVGVLTTLMLIVGFDSLGGLLAFFQLGLLVGAPLAVILQMELRSWPVSVVVVVPLSIALSAISTQFLIWFRVGSPPLIVLTASAYGIGLALLVASAARLGESRAENA